LSGVSCIRDSGFLSQKGTVRASRAQYLGGTETWIRRRERMRRYCAAAPPVPRIGNPYLWIRVYVPPLLVASRFMKSIPRVLGLRTPIVLMMTL
jgi:hypothetical protein